MGEKISFENRRISDFQGLVTLTLNPSCITRLGGVDPKTVAKKRNKKEKNKYIQYKNYAVRVGGEVKLRGKDL